MANPTSWFAPGIRARVRPGPGPAILWVHGYTLDSSVWDEVWSLLPGYEHIGIDLPGHGESDPTPPDARLTDLGERLADAAAGRGVAHVVGLSLGSMIALQVALSRPGRFATLTMAAPALAGGPLERDVGIRFQELAVLYYIRGAGPWMTELWMQSPPETFAHASPALRESLAAVIDRHTWSEFGGAGLGIAGLARQPQTVERLADATGRLLILIGEWELPAFRRTAEILRSAWPGARTAELPGVGHLCLLQAPEPAAQILADYWSAAGEREPAGDRP